MSKMFTRGLMLGALAVDAYPVSYNTCGTGYTATKSPERVVTMNQGATEFMLALGLHDKMAGTAYLDDYIWPRYATEYAKIPVLSSGYPNETTIMSVDPDFIVASYNSAFRSTYLNDKNQTRGIFSEETVGPCVGKGSEWEGAKNTCRPQLHDAGIGTYLFSDACEDTSLRPPTVTEATVYSEMRDLGSIFDVDVEPLIKEMEEDFDAAAAMVSTAMHGKKLTAVWLDCVGRCCKDEGPEPHVFVGSGQGAPQLLMREAGLENVFAEAEGNWKCVPESEIIAAAPDVFVVVHAAWDTAVSKLQWLYNHTEFCDMDVLKGARFVQIPFSATTLGPRNGPAALDLAIASIHVRTGGLTPTRESGVSSFDPNFVETETEGLACTLKSSDVATYRAAPATATPTPASTPASTPAPTASTPASTPAPTTAAPATPTPEPKPTEPPAAQDISGCPQLKGAIWPLALGWMLVLRSWA